MILAIDPGSTESGIVFIGDDYKPIFFDILPNEKIVPTMELEIKEPRMRVVIEMIGHYGTGMPAGKDVFDTCIWIGRFIESFARMGQIVHTLPRGTVKLNLCNSAKAKDQNVIQALVDRFDREHGKYGKGTKNDPGFFYGFRDHIWQAYALGITFLDLKERGEL